MTYFSWVGVHIDNWWINSITCTFKCLYSLNFCIFLHISTVQHQKWMKYTVWKNRGVGTRSHTTNSTLYINQCRNGHFQYHITYSHAVTGVLKLTLLHRRIIHLYKSVLNTEVDHLNLNYMPLQYKYWSQTSQMWPSFKEFPMSHQQPAYIKYRHTLIYDLY